MSYSVDTSKPIWRINFWDTMTSADVAGAIRDITKCERGGAFAADRLIDLTRVNGMNIGFTEIFNVVQQRNAFPPANRLRTAIVTNNPIQFGVARMFQGLLNVPQVTVQLFPTEEEAMQWLESKNSEG